jgi:hypothetical protein
MSRQTGKEVTVTSLRVRQHLIATAVLAGTALLAAACGSSAPPAAAPTVTQTVTVTPTSPGLAGGGTESPSPTGSGSGSGSGGAGACATSSLKVSIGNGDGAAGSVYYPIVFTNSSGSSCSLFGFPGVSFVVGGSGSQLGDAATRNSDKPVQTVTLAPGDAAHATLQVVQALNFPAAKCQPVNAHFLKIFPPNQTDAVTLSFDAKACAATGKGATVLNVSPVQAGISDS